MLGTAGAWISLQLISHVLLGPSPTLRLGVLLCQRGEIKTNFIGTIKSDLLCCDNKATQQTQSTSKVWCRMSDITAIFLKCWLLSPFLHLAFNLSTNSNSVFVVNPFPTFSKRIISFLICFFHSTYSLQLWHSVWWVRVNCEHFLTFPLICDSFPFLLNLVQRLLMITLKYLSKNKLNIHV